MLILSRNLAKFAEEQRNNVRTIFPWHHRCISGDKILVALDMQRTKPGSGFHSFLESDPIDRMTAQ